MGIAGEPGLREFALEDPAAGLDPGPFQQPGTSQFGFNFVFIGAVEHGRRHRNAGAQILRQFDETVLVELGQPLVGRKRHENSARVLGDQPSMPRAMLGIAEDRKLTVGLGRAGSLVDWEDQVEQRAYVVFYRAEQIINWRVERVRGKNVPTLVVLLERAQRKVEIADSQSQMANGRLQMGNGQIRGSFRQSLRRSFLRVS